MTTETVASSPGIVINNGVNAPIEGLATAAGILVRGDVAVVAVEIANMTTPPPGVGAEMMLTFCGSVWLLQKPGTQSQDRKTLTFTFRRK